MNGWMDLDDTHICYGYWWDGKVDLRSRSQGQRSRSHICVMENYCFSYKSWMDRWILMILTYIIDIDETVKLTQGLGHKVKGQGHITICNCHMMKGRKTDGFFFSNFIGSWLWGDTSNRRNWNTLTKEQILRNML